MRPTRMRMVIAAVLAAAALPLAACGSSPSEPSPGAASSQAVPMVTAVPAATAPVTGLGTVIEKPGSPPELCLGPVAESWPPQCQGIPLVGWDWASNPPDSETEAGAPVTRWGTYAITGTFDRTTLTVTSAVSLALYDTMAQPSPTPVPPPDLSDAQWDAVESALRATPGLLTSGRSDDRGPVLVSVVHDDGSIQAWADASFGPGAVVVTSALR